MSEKRIFQYLIYVAVCLGLMVGLIAIPKVYSQVCKAPSIDNMARFQGMPRDANGNVHVKVNYQSGGIVPDPSIGQAMQTAIAEWNSFSSTTHVVFDLNTPATTPDLNFEWTNNSALTGSCARFDQPSNTIFHGVEMESRLAALGQAEIAVVFKHEIGHYLGLGHTTTPETIMNQPNL